MSDSEKGPNGPDQGALSAGDRARFDGIRAMPRHWFKNSEDLRLAAATLWASSNREISDSVVRECGLDDLKRPSVFVRPVFLMLCGLSLELLAKGILVAQGKEPPTRGASAHYLVNLYQLAGLKVSVGERALLEVLTGAIVWIGKYPVPTKPEELGRYVTLAFAVLLIQGEKDTFAHSGALDWPRFDALWKNGERAFLASLRPEGETAK